MSAANAYFSPGFFLDCASTERMIPRIAVATLMRKSGSIVEK